jgi:hypothetical protein
MAEIFKFPYDASRRVHSRKPRSTGVNIRTLCFRSYDLIVESDETELLRDVCRDTHKAEVKLRKVKERLQGERERSAALIELLTAAETRLSGAIVAALLSNRREG